MTGGFLVISPQLRQTLADGVTGTLGLAQQYSPYSYVAVVLAIFGGVSMVLVSGSSPR